MSPELKGQADFAAGALLVVATVSESDLSGRPLEPLRALAACGLRNEVQEATDAAAAIDRRGRTLHNLDVIRGSNRSLKVAPVLHSTKSAEEVVADVAAQEHAARDAEVAAGERSGRDSNNVVDRLHGVAFERFRIGHRDGPRRFLNGLGETEETGRG